MGGAEGLGSKEYSIGFPYACCICEAGKQPGKTQEVQFLGFPGPGDAFFLLSTSQVTMYTRH